MQMFANYIAEKFREFGIFAWIHVDDLLAAHKIFLYAITSFITFLLMKSGIRVNTEKSQLEPAKQIEFLGSLKLFINMRTGEGGEKEFSEWVLKLGIFSIYSPR